MQSLLAIVAFATLLLIAAVFGTPSLHSSKNALQKGGYRYYPPAEPDYPPINPYPASAKLPVSSKSDLENDKVMPKNSNDGKIYGERLMVRVSSVPHPDNFNRDKDEPKSNYISNPASYYLQGAQLDKIKTPTCRLSSCHGPYPNDGSLLINKDKGASDEQCEQIFVTMNGCIADKGYPIGMICTVCCHCGKQFIIEMHNSRGFLEGFNWK